MAILFNIFTTNIGIPMGIPSSFFKSILSNEENKRYRRGCEYTD